MFEILKSLNFFHPYLELFNVIKTQYDAEFKVEDIPKHLS